MTYASLTRLPLTHMELPKVFMLDSLGLRLTLNPRPIIPALAILLMYADGISVGTGLISIKDGIGRPYWGGVHSDHRNKRLGTALAHARMKYLKDLKDIGVEVDTIWVQAMSPSIGLFKRIGFEEGEAVTFYRG